MADFTFYRGRKKAYEEIFFLFLNLNMLLRNSTPGSSSPAFDKRIINKFVEIFAKEIEEPEFTF